VLDVQADGDVHSSRLGGPPLARFFASMASLALNHSPKISEMTTKHKLDNPILVTGAAGAVGGIGRNLTEFLLAKGAQGARLGSA
jgi:hypothetical protein